MSEAREPKMLTPVKAIRAHCLKCMGGHEGYTDQQGKWVPPYHPYDLVRKCPEKDRCPLYPYRLGRNPSRAGIGAESATLVGLA